MNEYKYAIIKEPIWKSVFKDVATFGCMFAMFYLNHRFCGGSKIVNISVALFIFFYLYGMMFRHYKTIPEAKEELARLEEKETVGSKSKPITSGSTHDQPKS